MASIGRRPSGQWRARFRDDGGREHARHFARRVDGQRWLDEQTASIVTGQYVDPKAGRVTVAEYAGQWQSAQVWRATTVRRVERDLRVHILPALGSRPLASVRTSDMQALVRALSTTLAASSARVVYATARTMFRAAVEDRLITSSPCTARVKLPSTAYKSLTIPEAAVVCSIAEHLPANMSAVVYVAAGLGLRPGEVFGLQVADVDFLRRSVTVQRQLDEKRRLVPLKTDSSYRTVPLPDSVGLVLSRHLADHERDALVFVGVDGSPVLRNSFGKAWRRAVDLAGVEGLRLHDMRHLYASALIHAGESVKTVQRRLGHSSAAMTLDVYSHLWPDSEDRSRSAIDAVLGVPADSVRTVGT